MPPRPQPYHRAGAMDVNARISTENALNMHVQTTGQPEAIYGPQCATNMQLSIQVGEPLYSHKRSVLGDYRPISILSGMNGLFFHQTAYDHLCRAATAASNVPKRTDNRIGDYLNAYDKMRDSFFSNLSYTGVSIDVWDYADDAQSDRIAITEGGLNTIDCDGPIYCGDIVIADMPWTRELCKGPLERNGGRGANVSTPYGLTECERSMKKVTLAVVALPRRPVNLHTDDDEAWRKFINGFYARGQIIGKCAKGNCSSKGGAIDIIQGICVGGQM